jgi:hypothetical protein
MYSDAHRYAVLDNRSGVRPNCLVLGDMFPDKH